MYAYIFRMDTIVRSESIMWAIKYACFCPSAPYIVHPNLIGTSSKPLDISPSICKSQLVTYHLGNNCNNLILKYVTKRRILPHVRMPIGYGHMNAHLNTGNCWYSRDITYTCIFITKEVVTHRAPFSVMVYFHSSVCGISTDQSYHIWKYTSLYYHGKRS